jgi:hypothetical protein
MIQLIKKIGAATKGGKQKQISVARSGEELAITK